MGRLCRWWVKPTTDFSSEFFRQLDPKNPGRGGYSLIVSGVQLTIEVAVTALMKTNPDETETITQAIGIAN